MKKLLETAIRAVITAFFSSIVAFKLCCFAYDERGYAAIGGEWFVIIGLTFAIWKLTGYIAEMERL